MMNKKTTKSLIISLSLITVIAYIGSNKTAYAGCESYYGGETCIYNKSFEIDKDVRIEGKDEWKDKVTDVDEDETVEFRIRIKNVGEIEVDNMKYDDSLPEEMERVGGSGLTEYWNDFEPGERVEYIIKAKVKSNEYDRKNFEKCIVNKVELEWDDHFEGSDTATVCYGDAEITELPETGPTAGIVLAISGMISILGGMLVRKQLA